MLFFSINAQPIYSFSLLHPYTPQAIYLEEADWSVVVPAFKCGLILSQCVFQSRE